MEYGRGFSEKTLRHMIRFAEAFPDSYGVIQPAQIDFSPLAVVLFRDAHADGRLRALHCLHAIRAACA